MDVTHRSRYRHLSSDEIEERRLNTIIVAATLAFVVVLIVGALAWVSSYEPTPGDSDRENVAFVD